MARELPAEVGHLHVHYLHTPASVVRYAALLTGRSWTFSAHAKDIWTTPDWEKREKLAEARWGVTCTAAGRRAPRRPSPRSRTGSRSLYHGLDLSRFPPPPEPGPPATARTRPIRSASSASGRAVAKKGFDDLLRALAALPEDLHWRFAHVGGGELLDDLKAQAARSSGSRTRCAFLGAKDQPHVVALLREADLFVLPSKEAASGDRDGLPNVLMEAASQSLAIVATISPAFRNSSATASRATSCRRAIGRRCRTRSTFSRATRRARAALGAAAFERLRRDFAMDGRHRRARRAASAPSGDGPQPAAAAP